MSPLVTRDPDGQKVADTEGAMLTQVTATQKLLYGRDMPKRQHLPRLTLSEGARARGCVPLHGC